MPEKNDALKTLTTNISACEIFNFVYLTTAASSNLSICLQQGVTRGQGGHAPNRPLSGVLWKKTDFVGT